MKIVANKKSVHCSLEIGNITELQGCIYESTHETSDLMRADLPNVNTKPLGCHIKQG